MFTLPSPNVKQFTEHLIIKVPVYWIKESIGNRQLVNKYETNAMLKAIGNYCILKTITTTGVLHDWKSQQKELKKLLKLSRNGLFGAIERLQKLGLIYLDANLTLVGWDYASQVIGLNIDEFISIDYCLDNNAKIEHYLIAAEVQVTKTSQIEIIQKKLKSNPLLKNELDLLIAKGYDLPLSDVLQLNIDQWLDYLKQLQIKTFVSGTLKTELYQINPDLNRSVVKLKKEWEFRSVQSIAYIKRKLAKLGLIIVNKYGAIISTNKNRISKMGNFSAGFDRLNKLPVWFLPDSIQINFQVCEA